MSDIRKTMEAYLEMVSERKCMKKEEMCPKCKADPCECDDEKEMDEAKKLDPVNDKENDKPFAKRKDKDIDNDGDVDSSDEYLHKKRAATDDAIDGGKKPADNAKDDKKKKPVAGNKGGKTAEISKIESTTKESVELDEGIMDKVKAGIKKVLGKYRLDKAQRKASSELRSYYDDWIASGGSEERFMELVHGTGKQMSLDIEPEEMLKDWLPKVRRANRKDDRLIKLRMKKESLDFSEDFEVLWSAIEEAVNQKKGATPPEGMDDKESKSGKDFKAMHKVDVKSHDDMEKIEEPKERKVKKEMTEFEVIRALLSGKPTGE